MPLNSNVTYPINLLCAAVKWVCPETERRIMKVQSIVSVAACVLVSSFISAHTASAHGHEVPAGTWKGSTGARQ